MHKRNLTITALILAALITSAFTFFPRLNHSDALGWFYFPSIFLSVVFSGGHSPSAIAGWSSFLIYTLFYWVVFLIIYVLLLEMYLLRQVLHHLDDAKSLLASENPDSKMVLDRIGQAIVGVETRRRKHFLLQPNDDIDLKESPHLLAARAITVGKRSRVVKALLKKLQSRLAVGTSPLQAHVKLNNLCKDAEIFI